MSIGENWLAPQPTANIANAILTQAPDPARVTVVVAMTSTLICKLSNLRLTMYRLSCSHGPDADLAAVASLIADRHRAQMLLALLGGTPQSGSALAEAAGISRSLASAHLKKLVAGGLVRAQPSGRHQLYSIASE